MTLIFHEQYLKETTRNNVAFAVNRASHMENSPGINIVSTLTVESLNPILNSHVSCQFFSQRSLTFFVNPKGK